jgi:hypothetical protein
MRKDGALEKYSFIGGLVLVLLSIDDFLWLRFFYLLEQQRYLSDK